MTTLSGIKVPFSCTVSPVKPKSSRDHDSKICVMTGPLVSLAKPLPFLQSSRLRFGCGLVGCSSASCLGVGVGATTGLDVGALAEKGIGV